MKRENTIVQQIYTHCVRPSMLTMDVQGVTSEVVFDVYSSTLSYQYWHQVLGITGTCINKTTQKSVIAKKKIDECRLSKLPLAQCRAVSPSASPLLICAPCRSIASTASSSPFTTASNKFSWKSIVSELLTIATFRVGKFLSSCLYTTIHLTPFWDRFSHLLMERDEKSELQHASTNSPPFPFRNG